MEMIKCVVSAERFDELVHGTADSPTLPQCGDTHGMLEIAAKPNCMLSGAAGVVISFYAVLPDGTPCRVQAVTSRKVFLAAADIIRNHPDLRDGPPISKN